MERVIDWSGRAFLVHEILEQRAERRDTFYVEVSRELMEAIKDWSQPVQIKLVADEDENPRVRTLAVRPVPMRS
ncbi:MAG: hypothetical protein E6G08_20595 [Actinobacteria bacterium]|nr:MAG: hypothetical protein E6G08_20595 [Actinomycetota bacterium]